MIVWRVEHFSHGYGPYVYDSPVKVFLCQVMGHSSPNTHPNSWIEGLDCDIRGRWRHGFETFEQLTRWFDGCEEKLEAAGYIICKFHIPENHVQFGKKQVIFRYNEAVRL